MQKGSLYSLMFHGVVDSLSEHCVFAGSRNCFIRTADFEKIIAHCSSHYKILRIKDLSAYFNGTASEDGVFITVDDGLQTFADHGIPVLEKYNAPATVFITSDWTNEGIEPAVFSLEYHLFQQLPATVEIVYKGIVFSKQVNSKKRTACFFYRMLEPFFQSKDTT
jgi:hypothetical protein